MAKGVDINALYNAVNGQGTQNPRYGLIGKLIGANLNSNSLDQAFVMNTGVTKYQPDVIQVTNCSGSASLAAGGIYTATAKGGTAVVAAAQVYSALNAATVVLALTIAVTTTQTANPLYLHLTTAQGGAMTADFYIWGYVYT